MRYRKLSMRLCTATGETIPEDGFKKDRTFCENLWGVKRKLNVKRRSLKTVLVYSAIYKQQPTTHISFKISQLLNEAVCWYPREKVKKEILERKCEILPKWLNEWSVDWKLACWRIEKFGLREEKHSIVKIIKNVEFAPRAMKWMTKKTFLKKIMYKIYG